jgi:hypothetical protein
MGEGTGADRGLAIMVNSRIPQAPLETEAVMPFGRASGYGGSNWEVRRRSDRAKQSYVKRQLGP